MTLQEKLDLWVRITGIDPSGGERKYNLRLDGGLRDYEIEKMNERIKETLDDDETGMFAEAYLSVYLNQFLKKKDISLLEIIRDEDFSAFINDIKALYGGLRKTNAEEVILSEAMKAMDFYKLPCSLDITSVIEIRTSAIRCMNGKLDLLQFSSGDKKADEFKFSKDIYMFDSLDALISCSADGSINGVTLGCVRDKEKIEDSFFAFIIKNGDNLYLLTDMPKYSRSAKKVADRYRKKNADRRIKLNYFPYYMVSRIDVDKLRHDRKYGTNKTKKMLSSVENNDIPYTVIGTIETLNEDEAFWLIMMASLIKKKFYESELPVLPLNYTRSMIASPLLEKTGNELIVQSRLPNFELKEVDIKDTHALEYAEKNEEYAGRNDYLINRYADKVDGSILNVIANTDKSKLLENMYAKRDYWGYKTECELLFLNLDDTSGTKEEIEYNQKWIARYNYAVAINREVKKDYLEKAVPLHKTIGEYIDARLETLIKMHLRNELLGYSVRDYGSGLCLSENKEPIGCTYEFNKWHASRLSEGEYKYGTQSHGKKSDIKCYFTNMPAGIIIDITPKTAEELALVCGISVNELPEELQHYNKKTYKYKGNGKLENTDPFLTVINDEFNNSMSFKITIALSKKKYRDFCREAGVSAEQFWEDEKPYCYKSRVLIKGCEGRCRWDKEERGVKLQKKCENCKWYTSNVTL